MFADQPRGLVAVHAGHVQVQQDDGELLGEQQAQRFLAGAGHDKFMTQHLQRLGGGEGVALVVVDDEHPSLERLRGGRGLALSHHQASAGMRGGGESASRWASVRWIDTRMTEIR